MLNVLSYFSIGLSYVTTHLVDYHSIGREVEKYILIEAVHLMAVFEAWSAEIYHHKIYQPHFSLLILKILGHVFSILAICPLGVVAQCTHKQAQFM